MVYTAPGMLAIPSVAEATTARSDGDPHPSQSMNHMFSLETSHKLDILFPRAPQSDKICNTNFLPL